MSDRPAAALDNALDDARRREKLSQAEWRRRRAEVARLIAAGEEAEAAKLLRAAGVDPASLPKLQQEPDHSALVVEQLAGGADTPQASRAAAEATQEQPTVQPSKATPVRGNSKRTAKPIDRRQTELGKVARRDKARASSRRRQVVRTAGWTGWVRRRPPWLLSLIGHTALLLALGLLSFGVVGEPGFELTAFAPEDDSWSDTPTPVELVEATLDTPTNAPAPSPSAVSLATLLEPIEFPVADAVGDSFAINPDALSAIVPSNGNGEAGKGAGDGAKRAPSSGKVRFFGAESDAKRVVFVVDNSGSMQRGRLETTLFELERAVQGLSHSQEFYVVFFSDQAYPMFFPAGIEEPIPASLDNKRRLSAWLHTIEMCLGGRLLDAMELAAATEPDVVYLLTDGDIRSERVVARMTAEEAWPFPIHTLGMGARTAEHLAILQVIASRSGGQFRPVAANPAAVRRAAVRPIRYHRTAGEVWGSKVQSWD